VPADVRSTDAEAIRSAYQAVDRIRPWKRGGELAPHKPLLLLLVLARVRDSRPRLVEFSEIESRAAGPHRHIRPKEGSLPPRISFLAPQVEGAVDRRGI
jgi:hypothetical protein